MQALCFSIRSIQHCNASPWTESTCVDKSVGAQEEKEASPHLLESFDMNDFGKPMDGEIDHHDEVTQEDEHRTHYMGDDYNERFRRAPDPFHIFESMFSGPSVGSDFVEVDSVPDCTPM